jgi:predicted DNA-binding protein
MWPLFSKNRTAGIDTPHETQARRPLDFENLLDGMGNLSDLAKQDTATKFWLPDPAEKALTELAKMQGVSMSALLREFFAAHCYGIYVVTVLRARHQNIFKDSAHLDLKVRFSISGDGGNVRSVTYWVPELGKNVAPVKIWIAKRLRDDLQALADHTEIPLSQYLREIVISRLLGHGMLPKRPEMLVASPLPWALDWCEDREVPFIQVDEDTFKRFPDGRKEIECNEDSSATASLGNRDSRESRRPDEEN